MIKKIEFVCDDIQISSCKNLMVSDSKNGTLVQVTAFQVNEDEIMDALSFEDVMNYYGVSKIIEWAEANR
jgi:hypothetical protein